MKLFDIPYDAKRMKLRTFGYIRNGNLLKPYPYEDGLTLTVVRCYEDFMNNKPSKVHYECSDRIDLVIIYSTQLYNICEELSSKEFRKLHDRIKYGIRERKKFSACADSSAYSGEHPEQVIILPEICEE